jgi:hypothetical protein
MSASVMATADEFGAIPSDSTQGVYILAPRSCRIVCVRS